MEIQESSQRITLSSHVLNTSYGKPAFGVPIQLQKLSGNTEESWVNIVNKKTNEDGRVSDFPNLTTIG